MHINSYLIQFYQVGVFYCAKACLQCSKIIFQSALIFKVLQDIFERHGMEMEVWRCIHRSNRLIQFYQVGVYYCSQACLKYFKVIDYINAKQSKKINFILWYPDKHSQYQQIDIVFSIGCVQAHSEFSIL